MIYAVSLTPDHPRALENLNAPESTRATDLVSLNAPLTPPIAVATPVSVAEEPEEARVNRYGARFGSAQGFDSETLRELKQMQDARDEAQRGRDEAARAARREEELRLEENRLAQIAAQSPVTAAKTQAEVPVVSEETGIEAPGAIATEAATAETQPLPGEAPVQVAPPQRPSLEPRRPSLEPRRPSLEPRRTLATPPAPVDTPEKTSRAARRTNRCAAQKSATSLVNSGQKRQRESFKRKFVFKVRHKSEGFFLYFEEGWVFPVASSLF